jgi:hypothetical protein
MSRHSCNSKKLFFFQKYPQAKALEVLKLHILQNIAFQRVPTKYQKHNKGLVAVPNYEG